MTQIAPVLNCAPPTTTRLRLATWDAQRHLPGLTAMNADQAVMRYFPATMSAADTQSQFDRLQAHHAKYGWGNWAVELPSTGEFIGFIGLSVPPRPLPFSPCVEVGWRLARAHWRQGYATEGAAACLKLGFEVLGLREIVSLTALINQPSIGVMEKIGMKNSGRDFDHPAVEPGSPLLRHCLYVATSAG